jgi:hypothetical protein
MKNEIIKRAPLLAAAVFVVSTASSGMAAPCGVTFTGNTLFVLNTDYEMNSQSLTPCITLDDGADLNMNGHKITCGATGVAQCDVAIKALDPGSTVKNTVAGSLNIGSSLDPTTYNGSWGTAVVDAEIVTDLRIEKVWDGITSRTWGATKIDGNTINLAMSCIDATLLANTSVISHNFCSTSFPYYSQSLNTYGIVAGGTFSGSGAKVQNNMVLNSDFGIWGTDRLRFDDNIVCEMDYDGPVPNVGVKIDQAGSQTGTHNLCCSTPEADADDCTEPGELAGGFHLWP